MRLAELSERSGVSTATIKYYLREGLLAPGRQINATTAEYDEEHLRRLRLVRAMIQVGRIPVATVREVLGHVDDDSLGRIDPAGRGPVGAAAGAGAGRGATSTCRAAHQEVGALLDRLGWENAKQLTTISPAYRSLVVAVAAFRRLGYDWGAEQLAPYAELMHRTAVLDLDNWRRTRRRRSGWSSRSWGRYSTSRLLQALHRLAQEEESTRRYGFE